mmetsp:Transcript_161988/g.295779  ORF Transcript_161988/g.295779 Transcript_161988/m.295779 type:complete len:149 (-) Transcript_161988:7-453(-)
MSGWVERSRDEWAKKYFQELFKSKKFTLDGTEGATMSFFSVETSGDCSLAIKSGSSDAPRPMFEFRIELDWKVEQTVDNGKSKMETKGQILVSEFGSEDIENPELKLSFDTKLPPGATPAFKTLMDKLHEAVRKAGVPVVKKMLAEEA